MSSDEDESGMIDVPLGESYNITKLMISSPREAYDNDDSNNDYYFDDDDYHDDDDDDDDHNDDDHDDVGKDGYNSSGSIKKIQKTKWTYQEVS